MNRTERLTAILLLLQEKTCTAGQIARHFEISRRTVLRDVQALSEMGVPVIAREGPGGGYSLPESYHLDPLALTANESFLLLLALSGITTLSDTPFSAERASLAAKLRALLPEEHLAALTPLLAKVALPAVEREQRAPHLDGLVAALQAGRWVRLVYRSAQGEHSLHCKPLQVYSQHGFWYCRAYAYESQGERTYRVDRVVRLEAPAEDFGDPPVTPGPPYDHPAHPTVRVRLSERGARLVEVEPHLAQALRPRPAGGASLEFRCPPEELEYYTRLFGGLGAEAEVLGPPELMARLAALGSHLAARYPPDK